MTKLLRLAVLVTCFCMSAVAAVSVSWHVSNARHRQESEDTEEDEPSANATSSTMKREPKTMIERVSSSEDSAVTCEYLDPVLNRTLRLEGTLGDGGCGKVFDAFCLKTNKYVAVKVANADRHDELQQEYSVHVQLGTDLEFGSITAVEHNSADADPILSISAPFLTMPKLGKSVSNRLVVCGPSLSLQCMATIGIRVLDRLETMHKLGFLHNDVKPENILLDPRKRMGVDLIDYGAVTRFRNERTSRHVPQMDGSPFLGTATYSSSGRLYGESASRRDDMESLGYVLIELVRGDLPWSREKDFQRIVAFRERVETKTLCCGVLPLIDYMSKVKKLGFSEEPDYGGLKGCLRLALGGRAFGFDWEDEFESDSEGED